MVKDGKLEVDSTSYGMPILERQLEMRMWLLSLVAVIAGCGSLACAFLVIFLPKSQTAGVATLKVLL
jgi:hypothetical protein